MEQNTSLLEHRNNQPNAAVAEIQEDILFSMAALDNEGHDKEFNTLVIYPVPSF